MIRNAVLLGSPDHYLDALDDRREDDDDEVGTAFVESMRGRLTADTFQAFAFAGDAIFTLRSKRTGQRFTYRLSQPSEKFKALGPETRFVSVLYGPDNGGDYQYVGYVRPLAAGGFYVKKKTASDRGYTLGDPKSQPVSGSPSWRALEWVLGGIQTNKLAVVFEQLEAWHEGRCGKCARRLTVPESIASGLGPVCAGRA